jgi:hypothetical protein
MRVQLAQNAHIAGRQLLSPSVCVVVADCRKQALLPHEQGAPQAGTGVCHFVGVMLCELRCAGPSGWGRSLFKGSKFDAEIAQLSLPALASLVREKPWMRCFWHAHSS